MKRFWTFTICGLLLAVAIPLLTAYWPRILLPRQCSPLYQRYYNVPGIEASYVKGFRINDTLAIDATLLHATDSASWERLKTDFSIPDLPPDFQQDIDSGIDLISTKLIPKSPPPPSNFPDAYPNDVLAVSSLNSTITVFHVNNDIEKHAVIFHNFEDSINQ